MSKILLTLLFLTMSHSRAEENILNAEEAIKNGASVTQYRYLAPHPLYPYLQYRDYRNHLTDTPPAEIVRFLRRYPNAPFAGWLAERAFPLWLSQGNNQAIIAAYHPGLSDESIECEYRLALLNSGQSRKAGEHIADLWLSDKSIESACDPLFARLIASGQLNSTLINKRFFLAMASRNTGLAKYLFTLLDTDTQAKAQLWLDIDAGNQPVENAYTLSDNRWRSAILADKFSRQLNQSPTETTAQALFAYRQHYLDDELSRSKLFNAIVRKIADDNDPQTPAAWAAIAKGQQDDNTTFDMIAYDLRRHDWKQLQQHLIEHLDPQTLNKAEIQYWLGKSFEKTGDRTRADYHYRNAAGQRDFFGFLAAEKLHRPLQMNDRPIRVSNHYADVVAQPAAYRARIWHHLGDNNRAAQEWQALLQGLSPEENTQAALFAANMGWSQQAILTLSKSKSWDALSLRFPLLYQESIRRLADKHHISPAAVYAIIRKESLFQADARSPAGAIGLMQVMPATASLTAQQYHIPYSGRQQLTDPETNLEIGSRYLADRIKQYGHLAYAAAAYNAGPNRVERWRQQYPDLPLDEWIAQIPFYETRDYVKRVLEYEKVYEYRLGMAHPSYRTSDIALW